MLVQTLHTYTNLKPGGLVGTKDVYQIPPYAVMTHSTFDLTRCRLDHEDIL